MRPGGARCEYSRRPSVRRTSTRAASPCTLTSRSSCPALPSASAIFVPPFMRPCPGCTARLSAPSTQIINVGQTAAEHVPFSTLGTLIASQLKGEVHDTGDISLAQRHCVKTGSLKSRALGSAAHHPGDARLKVSRPGSLQRQLGAHLACKLHHRYLRRRHQINISLTGMVISTTSRPGASAGYKSVVFGRAQIQRAVGYQAKTVCAKVHTYSMP